VFLLNRMEDLLMLTVCPEQKLYLSKQLLVIVASPDVAWVKITKSSAKRRWFKGEQDRAILKPRRLIRSKQEITLVPIIKRKGESESPCLRPFEGENKPKGLPLSKTENEDVEIYN